MLFHHSSVKVTNTTIDDNSSIAMYVDHSGTTVYKLTSRDEDFVVGYRLIPLRSATKVCDVFRNSMSPSIYGE